MLRDINKLTFCLCVKKRLFYHKGHKDFHKGHNVCYCLVKIKSWGGTNAIRRLSRRDRPT